MAEKHAAGPWEHADGVGKKMWMCGVGCDLLAVLAGGTWGLT